MVTNQWNNTTKNKLLFSLLLSSSIIFIITMIRNSNNDDPPKKGDNSNDTKNKGRNNRNQAHIKTNVNSNNTNCDARSSSSSNKLPMEDVIEGDKGNQRQRNRKYSGNSNNKQKDKTTVAVSYNRIKDDTNNSATNATKQQQQPKNTRQNSSNSSGNSNNRSNIRSGANTNNRNNYRDKDNKKTTTKNSCQQPQRKGQPPAKQRGPNNLQQLQQKPILNKLDSDENENKAVLDNDDNTDDGIPLQKVQDYDFYKMVPTVSAATTDAAITSDTMNSHCYYKCYLCNRSKIKSIDWEMHINSKQHQSKVRIIHQLRQLVLSDTTNKNDNSNDNELYSFMKVYMKDTDNVVTANTKNDISGSTKKSVDDNSCNDTNNDNNINNSNDITCWAQWHCSLCHKNLKNTNMDKIDNTKVESTSSNAVSLSQSSSSSHPPTATVLLTNDVQVHCTGKGHIKLLRLYKEHCTIRELIQSQDERYQFIEIDDVNDATSNNTLNSTGGNSDAKTTLATATSNTKAKTTTNNDFYVNYYYKCTLCSTTGMSAKSVPNHCNGKAHTTNYEYRQKKHGKMISSYNNDSDQLNKCIFSTVRIMNASAGNEQQLIDDFERKDAQEINEEEREQGHVQQDIISTEPKQSFTDIEERVVQHQRKQEDDFHNEDPPALTTVLVVQEMTSESDGNSNSNILVTPDGTDNNLVIIVNAGAVEPDGSANTMIDTTGNQRNDNRRHTGGDGMEDDDDVNVSYGSDDLTNGIANKDMTNLVCYKNMNENECHQQSQSGYGNGQSQCLAISSNVGGDGIKVIADADATTAEIARCFDVNESRNENDETMPIISKNLSLHVEQPTTSYQHEQTSYGDWTHITSTATDSALLLAQPTCTDTAVNMGVTEGDTTRSTTNINRIWTTDNTTDAYDASGVDGIDKPQGLSREETMKTNMFDTKIEGSLEKHTAIDVIDSDTPAKILCENSTKDGKNGNHVKANDVPMSSVGEIAVSACVSGYTTMNQWDEDSREETFKLSKNASTIKTATLIPVHMKEECLKHEDRRNISRNSAVSERERSLIIDNVFEEPKKQHNIDSNMLRNDVGAVSCQACHPEDASGICTGDKNVKNTESHESLSHAKTCERNPRSIAEPLEPPDGDKMSETNCLPSSVVIAQECIEELSFFSFF